MAVFHRRWWFSARAATARNRRGRFRRQWRQGADSFPMAILYRYLRHYWKLVAMALVLAAINQVFSLLDPLIFRHIIDSYATRYREYTSAQFLRGVSVLLAAAVGVAFVSRVAKNFQDYFVNVITQQVGARIYADGIRHSLELPYTLFEDQRSGETLGKLQKVRTDVERFITLAVNMVFTTLIGLVFVIIYAAQRALVGSARVSRSPCRCWAG